MKRTRTDESWLATAGGYVVKMVHLLLLDLPLRYRYRVVLMRRNLQEVIVSQNTMLRRLNQDEGSLPPERLQAIYRTHLDRVTSYLREHADHFQLLEVDYNRVLQDALPEAERISRYLDGLDTAAMCQVVDAKLYRNRAAGGSPGVRGQCLS